MRIRFVIMLQFSRPSRSAAPPPCPLSTAAWFDTVTCQRSIFKNKETCWLLLGSDRLFFKKGHHVSLFLTSISIQSLPTSASGYFSRFLDQEGSAFVMADSCIDLSLTSSQSEKLLIPGTGTQV